MGAWLAERSLIVNQGNGGASRGELSIVCPTCDGILEIDGVDGIASGDPIRAFCMVCSRDVEVTAPPGITTAVDGAVDRVERAVVSEFPTNRDATHR